VIEQRVAGGVGSIAETDLVGIESDDVANYCFPELLQRESHRRMAKSAGRKNTARRLPGA
jgi:hypothetical protein